MKAMYGKHAREGTLMTETSLVAVPERLSVQRG
eukprot:COSAG03_NODE_622_length_6665_cov_18.589919_9_plen_33_part_00